MLIFYLTVPFMLLGAAIAIVPVMFAMRHEHEWQDGAPQPVIQDFRRDQQAQTA